MTGFFLNAFLCPPCNFPCASCVGNANNCTSCVNSGPYF
jgi:hypothetical protein